jgi:GDP-L-fucose synthase
LAGTIRDVVGFRGSIRWDTSKPDGTPRKLLDVSRIKKLGWRAEIELQAGIAETYKWYESTLNAKNF